MASLDGTTDPNRKWAGRPQSSTLPGRNQKPPRMVDKELQRIKRLAVVSGLNKAFSQEPQPIISSSSNSGGVGAGPTPSSSSVSSMTSSMPHRPSTVCGLSDLRQPQQTQSSVVSSTLSQRSSGSSLHFDYMQYKRQMKRRSHTTPVQKSKAVVLDELEKDLLVMFEEAYLRAISGANGNGGVGVAHSVATQEMDADRIDSWVVSVLPSVATNPNPESHHQEDDVVDDHHHQNHAESKDQHNSKSSTNHHNENGEGRVKELEATVKRLNQAQQQHTQWEQSIQQVVATYMEQKETEAGKARQLSQVVLKQERLIEQMQNHLDQVVAANANLRSCFQENSSWGQMVESARDELTEIKTEISVLTETKQSLEEAIAGLQAELGKSQRQVQTSFDTTQKLESECQSQRHDIDEKLEALKRQLSEKDTLLQKYRIYGDQQQQKQQHPLDVTMPRSPSDESVAVATSNSNSSDKRTSKGGPDTRRSSYASVTSTSIPRPPPRGSRRSSANTTSSSRRSYIARWTGGPLPPAAPPPTDPLPPIPVEMDKQRGVSNDSSSISHINSPTSLSSASLPNNYKVVNRPSIDSSAALSVDEEEAYREFAEQLQARLSVSKEIDELQVWQPNDFDEVQKRIDAKWGDMQDDDSKRHSLATLASKDGGAFWRGMKKKLRV
ncbi:hypothetical protein BDB00DRAFT_804030 [Zychaea mexicana]|uniref:uncharacterized protein n=1 Tax=Zychaea mexicana TaxID=64656 RepID=UPI0022FE9979|nr:uncharacterized protein BDB00DRAFT_804030 [Zychaea mexicana]KAI9497781.1 hypothetical protein BDB00DRAFT_804030 [Zychaea mexicana]